MADRMIRKQFCLEPEQEAQLKDRRPGWDCRIGPDPQRHRPDPSPLWSPALWQKEMEFAQIVTPVDKARAWSREELYDR